MAISNKQSTTPIKSIGNDLVFYCRNEDREFAIDGQPVTAKVAFVKSTTQKDHSAAINWMRADGVKYDIKNEFHDVYIIPHYYHDRMNNKVLSVLLKTDSGAFVVDMYIADFSEYILGTVTIESTGKLQGKFKLAQNGSKLVIVSEHTKITNTDGKLKKSDLEVGREYKTSRNNVIYLGEQNGQSLFLTDKFVYQSNLRVLYSNEPVHKEQLINLNGTVGQLGDLLPHKLVSTVVRTFDSAMLTASQTYVDMCVTINVNEIQYRGLYHTKSISNMAAGEMVLSAEVLEYITERLLNVPIETPQVIEF